MTSQTSNVPDMPLPPATVGVAQGIVLRTGPGGSRPLRLTKGCAGAVGEDAVQAPNANAFAERWIRTVRADCLDRILILGRSHLERVLRVYRRHYNEHRPHRALQLLPPDGRDPTPLTALADLRRRELLGGLIHEYEAA